MLYISTSWFDSILQVLVIAYSYGCMHEYECFMGSISREKFICTSGPWITNSPPLLVILKNSKRCKFYRKLGRMQHVSKQNL